MVPFEVQDLVNWSISGSGRVLKWGGLLESGELVSCPPPQTVVAA